MRHAPKRIRRLLQSWRKDRRGAAAIEFALVVPIMLVMYLGTIEISAGVSINRKVSRVASTVADLVTQQTTVTKNDLNGILEIGESILFPYTSDQPTITITAINVKSSWPQGGKVAWARRLKDGSFDDAGLNKNTNTWVPVNLRIDDTFLIRVDAELDYIPIVNWLIGDTVGTKKNGVGVIEMSERYFLRPRLGAAIDCSNC